jgi:hypothetical protein
MVFISNQRAGWLLFGVGLADISCIVLEFDHFTAKGGDHLS